MCGSCRGGPALSGTRPQQHTNNTCAFLRVWMEKENARAPFPSSSLSSSLSFITAPLLSLLLLATITTFYQEIWNIANVSRTQAALLENDFYRALRLLALSQKGYPASGKTMGDPKVLVPPPSFSGLEKHFPILAFTKESASAAFSSIAAVTAQAAEGGGRKGGPGRSVQQQIQQQQQQPSTTSQRPMSFGGGMNRPNDDAGPDPFADLIETTGGGSSANTNSSSYTSNVLNSNRGRGDAKRGGGVHRTAPGNVGHHHHHSSAPSRISSSSSPSPKPSSKSARPHYKKGERVWYIKSNETVRIAAPHFDDPDEMYYTIVRPNGSEKMCCWRLGRITFSSEKVYL
eukprot:jgi/Bigna1/75055/fgenesh1_pg.32_\